MKLYYIPSACTPFLFGEQFTIADAYCSW